MNAPNHGYNEQEFEYQVDHGRRGDQERERRPRRPQYSRAGSRPGAFNGIHRRRNKRLAW